MRVHRDPFGAADLPAAPVLSIGNFDGVHLGHRAIVGETVRRARAAGAPAAVLTFDPHPLAVLRPGEAPRMLEPLRRREERLAALGIDDLLVVPFTRDFSLVPAEDFVADFLVRRLAVREVVIGESFCFGRGRGGDLALLARLGREAGFVAHGIPAVVQDGVPISSSRIRRSLAAGEVEQATELLGRPFAVEGLVARGAQVGRTLGFPTLNVRPDGDVVPARGVYRTRIFFPSRGENWPGVTNIGLRPTLYEDGESTVESFLLGFSGDAYGETARVEFLDRIREERRFDSVDELAAQIARDVALARERFAADGEPA